MKAILCDDKFMRETVLCVYVFVLYISALICFIRECYSPYMSKLNIPWEHDFLF